MIEQEQTVERKYLLPCRGYLGSVQRDLCPPDVMTPESRNWIVMPGEGLIVPRFGYLLDSPAAGALESRPLAAWSPAVAWRVRQGLNLPINGLSNSNPSFLYTDGSDYEHYGQLLIGIASNSYKVLGHDMGTTHYPATGGVEPNAKMIPLPYLSGGVTTPADSTSFNTGVGYNRCQSEIARRFTTPGSFRGVQVGNRFLSPSLHGTPSAWDMNTNPTSSTGSAKWRLEPWGWRPPLFPPEQNTAALPSTSEGPWKTNDKFYLSVIFQMEDGSLSMPFIPRGPTQTNGLAGYGLITVAAGPGSAVPYPYIVYKNIPLGPRGCVRRILCRSNKVNVHPISSGGDGRSLSDIDPLSLKIIDVIENNTQTAYTDYRGDDTALRTDSNFVRFDHMWPLPARVAFTMERRTAIGYTRRMNPCAMIVAPSGNAASCDLNAADTSTAVYSGIPAFCVQLKRAANGDLAFVLRKAPYSASAPTDVALISDPLPATTTLNDLVERCFFGTAVGTCGEWRAQLVPGVNGDILASNLQPTTFLVADCTLSTGGTGYIVTTSAAFPYNFADVAVGMRVRVNSTTSGSPALSATAYVIRKTSNTSIEIGTSAGARSAATGAGVAVLEFWSDTGDDSVNSHANFTARRGNVRAFCPSFPMVLAFHGRFLDSFSYDRQSVWMTGATPGASSMASQSFFNNEANRKSAHSDAGYFQGGVGLNRGAVCAYSESIYALENRKGGATGEDLDYHLFPLNRRRGCTQFGTVAGGDGWAVYLTTEGLIATDGEREVSISNALYNPGTGLGEFRDVAQRVVRISPGNQFSQNKPNAHVTVYNGELYLAAEISNGLFDYAYALYRYNFSHGIAGSGLDEILLNGDSERAWSSPQFVRCGPIVGIPQIGVFAACDDNTGTSFDGNIYKLEGQNSGGSVSSFDPLQQFVIGSLQTSGGTLTAPAEGGFLSVPVGCTVTGSGITGTATVVDKDATGTVLTLSGVFSANTTNAVYTFSGTEVLAFAYLCADQVESLSELKAIQRITARCRIPSGMVFTVIHNRDLDRTVPNEVEIPATGTAAKRSIKEMPMRARVPGQLSELVVRADNCSRNGNQTGNRAALWGVIAEIEVHDALR